MAGCQYVMIQVVAWNKEKEGEEEKSSDAGGEFRKGCVALWMFYRVALLSILVLHRCLSSYFILHLCKVPQLLIRKLDECTYGVFLQAMQIVNRKGAMGMYQRIFLWRDLVSLVGFFDIVVKIQVWLIALIQLACLMLSMRPRLPKWLAE